MTFRDFAWQWALTYLVALSAFAARMAWLLFGVAPDPPDDPAEHARWRRKRLWLFVSEFSALPMFTTLAVLSTAQGWVTPVLGAILCCVSGALGFAFFVHALEFMVRRRIGMPEP